MISNCVCACSSAEKPTCRSLSPGPPSMFINSGSFICSLSDDAACWPTSATQASYVWQTPQRDNETSLRIKTTSSQPQLSPGGPTPQVVVSLDKFLFRKTLQKTFPFLYSTLGIHTLIS